MLAFVKKIRAGLIWVRALDMVANEKYQEAYDSLQKIGKSMGKSPEYHVLLGFVMFATDEFNKAVKEIDQAESLLEQSSSYSGNDKNYLLGYMNYWRSRAYHYQGNEELSDICMGNVNYQQINLSHVQEALLLNFPLRSHPEWGLSRPSARSTSLD